MDLDLEVKMAVYHHFAASGARPSATEIARGLDASVASVREAFGRLRMQRVWLFHCVVPTARWWDDIVFT